MSSKRNWRSWQNTIQLDSEAATSLYTSLLTECKKSTNRPLGYCDAKLFFEGHGRRFNPVDLLFGPCWSSCTRGFGQRRPVRVGREAEAGGRAEAPGQSRHGRSRAWPGSNPGSDPPMDPRARIQLRIRSAADPRTRIQLRIRPARGPAGPDPTKDPAKKNPDPTHGSGSKPVDPRVRIHRRLDLVLSDTILVIPPC